MLGPLSIYASNGTTPLAGAAGSNGGVGFVVQLGYYTGATTSNAFLGTWTPVFGPSTSNSLFSTAGMGDDGGTVETGTNDEFSFTGTVTSATASTEVGIPSAGQIMSIRYYNATTVAGATDFGAISDPSGGSAWLWESPVASPSIANNSYSFSDPGVTYQGGASEPETNIASAVPEPASLSLIGGAIGIGAAILSRRKKMRV